MRTYKTGSIGSLLAGGDLAAAVAPCPGQRFSIASLRRRIYAAVLCGGCACRKKNLQRSHVDAPVAAPSGRLSELLHAEISDSGSDDEDVESRGKLHEELRAVAKRLQCEEHEAARDVRRLAKDDPEARTSLATLGAIPPLVSMLDPATDPEILIAALYGLLNLGIGNNRNKEAIVKAGAVHKMMDLVDAGCPAAVSDAIVANFLGLTALDANKKIVGVSGAIPFLTGLLREQRERRQVREDALRALYNLSLAASNAAALVEAGAVAAAVGAMEDGERALAVLANLVGTAEGRREAMEWLGEVAEALRWADDERCQERAAYVMMVMAHAGYWEAVKAAAEGELLEVALVGTPLAQRRAARALEWVRVGGKGKGKGVVGDVSAPQCGGEGGGRGAGGRFGEGEARRAVRELVQQSLQSNMRRIARRANLNGEKFVEKGGGDGRMRAIAGQGTSKSLPF